MLENVKEWSERPFNPAMGVWGWAAFIVLILIVIGLWATVLNIIKKGVS